MIAPDVLPKENPGVAAGVSGERKNVLLRGEYTTTRKGPSPLELAKERLTIADAWHLLALPGKPGKSCKNPSREDRNPSLSVFAEGRLFKDFATSENGDVVAFVAMVLGLTASEAAKKLIAMAGTGNGGTAPAVVRPITPRPSPAIAAKAKPTLPELRKPTPGELLAIQHQRKLPESYGLEIAVQRGLLWTGEIYDHESQGPVPAWILTDDSRWNAQARRMDGKPWLLSGGTSAKAKTLPGSSASWPIGAANLENAQNVIFTEGPPDMLAAITAVFLANKQSMPFMDGIGFVCVAGAKNSLHPESLPCFKGRRVRIVPHMDLSGTGMGAAEDWAKQLLAAGARVEWFDLAGLRQMDGGAVKDLNDFTYYATDNGWDEPTVPDELAELAAFPGDKSEVAK
jgi:hypothetical protein